MKKILSALLPVLLLAACAKDLPPVGGSEDPVFTVFLDAGGDTTGITAGQDDYYMFTGFEQDTHRVLYSGSFARTACSSPDCAETLTFEFREALPAGDNFFHEGEYQYVSTQVVDLTGYQAFFRAVTDSSSLYDSFEWSFDGSPTVSNGTDSISMFFLDTLNPVSVNLFAFAANGQTSSVQRFVPMTGPPDDYPGVDILVDYQGDTLGYALTAITTGPGVQDISWSTGSDQFSISEFTLSQSYSVSVSNGSPYPASATLENIPVPLSSTRTANFEYSVTPTTTVTEIVSGEIAIQWVDRADVIWRSDRGQQLSNAIFRVLEVEDYQLNENGQKTRKLRVEFDCLLYNGVGESMNFTGAGVIGVAYP